MSHWLLVKFLSFMTDIEDGIRVTCVHIYRTKPHTIDKTPMNHKSVN